MKTYFFSRTERRILKSVCAEMVGVARDATLDEPLEAIDAFVLQLPKALQVQLRCGLFLFEWSPLLFILKPCRFTRLSSLDAARYIETWAASRFGARRLLFRGLRDMAFLGYYANRTITF
ncbi:hypothetical protein C6495_15065 [Candidatus Poribacteria bacterium]|nr:MAG: hypothetical protein C6495_15065 [Candidatus Poribacteria bacterium]